MSSARVYLFSLASSAIITIALFFALTLVFLPNQQKTVSPQNPVVNSFTGVYTLQSLEQQVQGISQKVSESVVSIVISRDVEVFRSDPFGFFRESAGTVRRKVGGGTGFFFHKDGYILTNKHVVADPQAQYVIITSSGKQYSARVLSLDPTTDLAILRAYTPDGKPFQPKQFLSFIDSSKKTQIGTFVLAIGNALAEFQNSVTLGVVSGLGRVIEAQDSLGGSERLTGLIQTDAAINPGNSGGPLVNLQGEVLGINTAIAAGGNGVGFSIPLSQGEVNNLLQGILKKGYIDRPIIGISYVMIDQETAKKYGFSQAEGAYIPEGNSSAILKDSPAAKAGIEPGDLIISFGGKPVKSNSDLRDLLKLYNPGDFIELEIIKGKTGAKLYRKLELQSYRALVEQN